MMSEASFASLGPTLLARKGGAKPAMRPQLTPLTEDLSTLAAIADEQLEDLGWNDMGNDRETDEHAALDQADNAGPVEHSLILSKPKPASVAHRHDDLDEDDFGADEYADEYRANYDDEREDEDEDAKSGPFEIIDPLAGAVVVPIGPHAAEHPTARRPAANEDTFDPAPASPEVVRQQERLAQHVAAEPAADAPLLWQKPAKKQPQSDDAGKDSAQPDRLAQPAAEPATHTTSQPRARAAGSKNQRRAAFTLRLDTERHLKLRLAATMQGVSAQSLVTEALDALLGDMEELDALVSRMQRD